MNIKKKLLTFICISLSILTLSSCILLPVCATEAKNAGANLPEPPELEGVNAVYFYNITSDKVIAKKNENLKVNTSTSAKVTMGLIACEKLIGRLNENVTITQNMLSGVEGTRKFGFTVGEVVSMSDLLFAAICGSYNDAAYIIAHIIAGSPEEFANMMTSRARELGASDTKYTNPIGSPDNSAMQTTARDTAKIALEASKNLLYMEISSALKHTVTTNVQSKEFYNNNRLIFKDKNEKYNYRNEKCLGMNVGYSGESGKYSLITLATDEDQKYICVILGGEESEDGKIYAYTEANKLINWACTEYQTVTVYKKGVEFGLVPAAIGALKLSEYNST